jgi:hypothetical protein
MNFADYAPTYPAEAYEILAPVEQDAVKRGLHATPGVNRLEVFARSLTIGTEALLMAIAGQRIRMGTAALIRQWIAGQK